MASDHDPRESEIVMDMLGTCEVLPEVEVRDYLETVTGVEKPTPDLIRRPTPAKGGMRFTPGFSTVEIATMLTFPVMVLGLLIVLLVGADAARRQITGKTPALTRGRISLAVAGMVLMVAGFFLLPTIAFVEYLL